MWRSRAARVASALVKRTISSAASSSVLPQVSRSGSASPAATRSVRGLYPESRPARPTGPMIFLALASIRLIPASRDAPPVVPRPTDIQLRLLDIDTTARLR